MRSDLNCKILILTLLIAGNSIPTKAAKIFALIALTTKSEKEPWLPLIDALGQRGHEVTVASVVKSNYSTPKVHEFLPIDYETFLGDAWADPVVERKNYGKYSSLLLEYDYSHKSLSCHKVYNNPEFQKAINQKYDLVLFNFFFQDCFLGILHKIQAPFIISCSMLPYHYLWELSGSPLPTSFVPSVVGPLRSLGKLSFWDRLENAVMDFLLTAKSRYFYLAQGENIYRQYLGKDVPGAYEIQKNFSLIFSNSHYTYNAPTPAMPDIIEVGGMHCRPPKPLPKDLEDFLSGAPEGFILFSMGSVLKSQYFPESLKNALLSAFSKLKQRVIWKFEKEIENLPPNVKISKWLPQQDVLGHPNIRAFITHGGAMSTFEAIYHGVPTIVMPIFCDQDINANMAVERGLGFQLEVLDITEESIAMAIREILTNSTYTDKAKEMSSLFRDQPQTPLDRAIFWAEYVIRHKGARHLRSSARDLTFIELHQLDVIFFLISLILSISVAILLVIRCFYRKTYQLTMVPIKKKKTK